MGKGKANGRTTAQPKGNGALPDWPATRPELWKLARIVPYERNPRIHPPEEISALAADMIADGVTMPILVDEAGIIIAGHGRRAAAELNGFERYPVVVARGWTEEQKRSARLRDNQRTLQGAWSPELVKLELTELKLAGYDLQMLGFPELQLRSFGVVLGTEGPDPEETPEPPKKPVSRRGDLWLLGDHRLLCGDATSESDVAMCLDGAKALLMATDPPYGVAYDNSERPNPGVAKPRVAKPRVANDEIIDGPKMQAFLESMICAALPHMTASAAFYFWHPMLTQGTYVAAAAAAGILIHRQIIWVKPVLLLGRGDYHWRHELCFYGWQQGHRPPWYGSRNQDTIWEVASVTHAERKEMNHATPKPVALWEKPILNHTKASEVVYEPFSGSGTQIIAAEKYGRRCCALELAPAYVDVGVLRWQQFTGRQATLEATGQTFDQAKAERAKKKPRRKAEASVTRTESQTQAAR